MEEFQEFREKCRLYHNECGAGWVELQPNVSRVRIIDDVEKMKELCREVGNSWGQIVHHMNGQTYTVIANYPPNKYAVYDPISDHQNGIIYVPLKAVTVIDEQVQPPHAWSELKPYVSRVRLMSDTQKMAKFCQEVGNSWGHHVHHMNGQTYTVVKNIPPNLYAVSDHQNGIINVPWKAITALEEDNFAAGELMEQFQNAMEGRSIGDLIEVDVRTPQGQIEICISSSSTVAECLWQVVNESGVLFNHSALNMGGEALPLDDSLLECGVEGGAHLTLVDTQPHQVCHLKRILESIQQAKPLAASPNQ